VTADFRWQGYTHQELYDALHTGPGSDASTIPTARWIALSDTLAEITRDLQHGTRSSAEGWTGAAAQSAREGIAPLARWAAEAQVDAEVMRRSTETQADYISMARADMPAPVKAEPGEASGLLGGLLSLFGGQIDAEISEAAQSAAETRAFEVMSAYQARTEGNTSTLGRFAPPPRVAGDVATGAAHQDRSRLGVPAQRPLGGVESEPTGPGVDIAAGFLVEAEGLFGDSYTVVPPVLGEH